MTPSSVADAHQYLGMVSSFQNNIYGHSDARRFDTLVGPPTPFEEAPSCSNSEVWPGIWLVRPGIRSAPAHQPGRFQLGVIPLLGILCQKSRVRHCRGSVCVENKEAMDRIAPRCGWKSFRDWALVAMSCQATCRTCSNSRTDLVHAHLANAVMTCVDILGSSKDFPEQFSEYRGYGEEAITDLVGISNIVHWMATIQFSLGIPMGFEKWDHHFLPTEVTLASSIRGLEKASHLTICKAQLWNVVSLADRTLTDLPDIVDVLNESKVLTHDHDGRHRHCTPSRCQVNSMNTARVGQIHKCSDPTKCTLHKFELTILLSAVMQEKSTAWLLDITQPRLAAASEKYIAISHVWSDGTGVGLEGHGRVNNCLRAYFSKLAQRLGCIAVWWDTLSIPLDDRARNQALRKMHDNYAHAEHTVVHDTYLLGISYADPGTACLAIVLSPWFTRGWTALELAMSNTVKVLFKGVDSMTPDIKDLDADILADSPSTSSRTHWLASCMIRRVRRHGNFSHISDLLATMRPRTTSWLRDRTIITGLLARVSWEHDDDESQIIRKIIVHLGSLPYKSLLHGQPTMFGLGPFSWCPASFDEMPIDIGTDMNGDLSHPEGNRSLQVDKTGAITGLWSCRAIDGEEIRRGALQPYGRHPETILKIHAALMHWEHCLLLQGIGQTNNDEPLLLATTFGLEEDEAFSAIIDCQYAGAVVLGRQDQGRRDSEWDDTEPWGCYSIRFGKDHESSPDSGNRNAAQLLEEADDMEFAYVQHKRGLSEMGPWNPAFKFNVYDQPSEETIAKADHATLQAHLFQATDTVRVGAMRHLIRRGAEPTPLYEDELQAPAFVKLRTLGSAFIDVGLRAQGNEIYDRATTLMFRQVNLAESLSTSEAEAFESIFLSQGRKNLAQQMYERIREESDEKFPGHRFMKRYGIAKLSQLNAR
ncbi:hypothetical protein B0I35DRAFT_446713 [Stachybotrys elegans]|uniref:Heterokaryon incompatibility domain-containing protein n=1 Tax=Stachybotrys elegans TaxID=80388 RepID=A0A8K0SD60_9HYPO|nr:hypothetical protein B0I35DRAFT_446713 [Stachybotrys elegans]